MAEDERKAAPTADEERNPILKILRMINRVGDEPRMAVLVTHGFLELMVNALVEAKCRHGKYVAGNNRDFPHSAKLLILDEKGLISDHHFRLLNWFRKLRNDSVHQPFFEITPERMSLLADRRMRRVGNFGIFCQLLLMDMWRSYDDIIGPVLMPDHYKIKEVKVVEVSVKSPEFFIPLTNDPEWVDSAVHDREAHVTEVGKMLGERLEELVQSMVDE